MMKMKQETMMCMWLIKHLENWDLWKRKLQVQSTYASWATKARLSWASLEQTAISCVCHHLTFFEAFIYSVPSLNEYDIPCCMIVKWYQDEKPAQKRSTALCTALKMSVGYGKDMGVGHRPELIMYCISFSYTAAVVTLDIKHFCWCPWGLVSQDWQAAHWQIPVKHLGIPCFFFTSCAGCCFSPSSCCPSPVTLARWSCWSPCYGQFLFRLMDVMEPWYVCMWDGNPAAWVSKDPIPQRKSKSCCSVLD